MRPWFYPIDILVSIGFNLRTVAKKKKQPEAKKDLPRFAVGEPVIIIRPHLWSGCTGEVISEMGGVHRVKIAGKDKAFFRTDVPGDQLEAEL